MHCNAGPSICSCGLLKPGVLFSAAGAAWHTHNAVIYAVKIAYLMPVLKRLIFQNFTSNSVPYALSKTSKVGPFFIPPLLGWFSSACFVFCPLFSGTRRLAKNSDLSMVRLTFCSGRLLLSSLPPTACKLPFILVFFAKALWKRITKLYNTWKARNPVAGKSYIFLCLSEESLSPLLSPFLFSLTGIFT